jgi:hypothetical protein
MSETRVFLVTFDVEGYQQLAYDLPGRPPLALSRFRGQTRAAEWIPQPVKAISTHLARPDIWHLAGAAALVLDDSVARKLEPFLASAGELLAVESQDLNPRGWILNITTDVDCLDAEQSVLGPGQWRLDFLPERLPSPGLFKVPPCEAALVLVLEKKTDPRPSFRESVEAEAFRGLVFREIWSSTRGSTSFSLF